MKNKTLYNDRDPFFSVVGVFMDQDEVQIFSHASIISNEKKPRVSYFAVAPFLFSFFFQTKNANHLSISPMQMKKQG